ncbi:MAG: hypothetical protein ACFFD4_32035 [Candidatus Odinarchaeota archaeon]
MARGQNAIKLATTGLHSVEKTQLAIFGTINVLTGRIHRFISLDYKSANFLRVLDRLVNYYHTAAERPICLMLDRSKAHRVITVKK